MLFVTKALLVSHIFGRDLEYLLKCVQLFTLIFFLSIIRYLSIQKKRIRSLNQRRHSLVVLFSGLFSTLTTCISFSTTCLFLYTWTSTPAYIAEPTTRRTMTSNNLTLTHTYKLITKYTVKLAAFVQW